MRITRFVNLNYIILFGLIYSKHFYPRIILSEIQNNGDLNDSINNININFNNHDSTLNITPGLIESDSAVPRDIPSPFKSTLFWPKLTEKKKKSKEKIPTVATSEEWLQYHLYKENEKTKKQQDIEERRKKREEIREKKKQERELKKNIKKEQIKKQKKK